MDLDQSIYLNARNINAFKNRGLVYYKLEKYIEAYKDIYEAIKIDPGDGDCYWIISAIYRKEGDEDKASKYYDFADEMYQKRNQEPPRWLMNECPLDD
jgi:tetratricopeptide (TPR) repeat protein